MLVIDQNGSRVREWCAECARYHKAENCKKARLRRRRDRQRDERWLGEMIALRDAVAAEKAARQA